MNMKTTTFILAIILLSFWAFPADAGRALGGTRYRSRSLTQSGGLHQAVSRDTTAFDTASCPRTDLTSGPLHARFYLPDLRTGYYRSTRFDWSGVIAGLDYHGHHLFGQWNSKYDPTLNDAIMGPVESFTPVGYDQAQPGSPFLQPGVGVLTRPDTAR